MGLEKGLLCGGVLPVEFAAAKPPLPAVDHLPRSGTGAVLAGALRPACCAEAPGTDRRAVVAGFRHAKIGVAKGGVVAADAAGGGAGAVEIAAAVAHLLGAGEGTGAVLAGAVRPTADGGVDLERRHDVVAGRPYPGGIGWIGADCPAKITVRVGVNAPAAGYFQRGHPIIGDVAG